VRITNLNDLTAVDATLAILFQKALRARNNSHSPYSKFQVGAAIRLQDGMCYSGCNVENASYGMTICAERTAVTKARSENGTLKSGDIQVVLVITDSGDSPAPPCGGCRSVMAEFDTAETLVYASNLDGSVIREFTAGELLPYSFEREFAAQLAAQ
jgi:cytidine deaminase